MQLNTSLELTHADQSEIAAILGCPVAQLNHKLNDLFTASAREYLAMIRGQKVFKRGSDILEYRLLLLIECSFGGTIPSEGTVSSLFQTTLGESRTLIRAVLSKYQYQLRGSIDATLRAALSAAVQANPGEHFSVVINSQNVIGELNKLLAEIDGKLSPVGKRKNSVATYEIAPSSYASLCRRLQLAPAPRP